MLQLDDKTVIAALQWLLGAFLVAIGWKGALRVRQDRRRDKAEVRDEEASELAHKVDLRTIERLEKTVDAMSKRIDAEIAVRREMEAEMVKLRIRADQAETRAEQAFARQRAAEEEVLLCRAQIAALEMQVQRLELGRAAGEMP